MAVDSTGLLPLEISNDDPIQGQACSVLGSALGLSQSITTGVVSAIHQIDGEGTILQITAPVSPGSSGSPVFSSRGEVIGIVTQSSEVGQNFNIAVGASTIINFLTTAEASSSDEARIGDSSY